MTELSPIFARQVRAGGPVAIRPAKAGDADAIGRVTYLAFRRFHESRGFAPDFPDIEAATGLARAQIADPGVYGVVAERDGAVIGANFLSEGDAIRGVGPIAVHPDEQGGGVGRRLMEAVIERGREARGIRLVQDAFNGTSMALYAGLGFDAREPLALMAGRPGGELDWGRMVRPLREGDLGAGDALCRRVHGFARAGELRGALAGGTAVAVVRDGRLTGYMTSPHFWILNHAVAESEGDLRALVLGAAALSGQPVSFLVPIRRAELFRWCLGQGLRVVKPMTLMTRGEYTSPDGAYLPSVLY